MTIRIFVPDIPEFMALIDGARNVGTCLLHQPVKGYWRIEAGEEIRLERKTLGLGPALWNSLLTGGFRGNIEEYDRDVLRITAES